MDIVEALREDAEIGRYCGSDYMTAADEIERLRAAAEKVIEMNRFTALHQYGDADKAESWACVRVLREALQPNDGGKRDE